MKKLFDFLKILIFSLIVFFLPQIIAKGMNWPFFKNVSGSESDWFSFLGGYLGAIITIIGVYWQVNKQSKDSKEQLKSQFEVTRKQLDEQIAADKEASFREARPLFILSFKEMIPVKSDEVPIYFPWQVDPRIATGDTVQFINIKNVSENAMAGVKINLFKEDRIVDEIMISCIRGYSECLIIDNRTLESIGRYGGNLEKTPHQATYYKRFKMQELDRIEVYFTTPIREKIKLTFVVRDEIPEYEKESRLIENKRDNPDIEKLDSYTLDNFQESNKV